MEAANSGNPLSRSEPRSLTDKIWGGDTPLLWSPKYVNRPKSKDLEEGMAEVASRGSNTAIQVEGVALLIEDYIKERKARKAVVMEIYNEETRKNRTR